MRFPMAYSFHERLAPEVSIIAVSKEYFNA